MKLTIIKHYTIKQKIFIIKKHKTTKIKTIQCKKNDKKIINKKKQNKKN